MAVHPFGAWKPDSDGLNSIDAGEAVGVFPRPRGYGPWPSLAALSIDALPTACKGAITARTSTGTYVVFAGTTTDLYKFAGVTTAWTEVTRSSAVNYAVPADGYWSFCQFDDIIIACNGVDAPQFIDADTGTNFEPIAGSPPIAKYCRVVGDHLMFMDLTTAQGPVASSGRIQVMWSGLRDYDYWTIGEKSCDFATFFDGGFVMGGTTLIGGLVFQQKAINRFVKHYDKIFDFAPIQEAQGTESPYSITPHESTTYFYGTDGFMAIGPDGMRQIGNDWIDEWFLENCDQTRVNEVVAAMDPVKMRWLVGFPTASADTGTFDHMLCFDALNPERAWTHAPISGEYLFSSASAGWSLTSVAADYATLTAWAAFGASVGSRVWAGGAPLLSAFNTSHKWSAFAGPPVEATMQTSRFQPVPGRRAYVNGFRPIDDAAAGTGRVATSERPQTAVAWGASSDLNVHGVIPLRASGRFHKFERVIPAGTDWGDAEARGIEFDDDMIRADGMR